MNPILGLTLCICGIVLLAKSGDAIHDMGPRTNHAMRLAHGLIATGALALVFSPLAHAEPKLHWAGMFLIVVGSAIKSIFERRRTINSTTGDRRAFP